MAAASEKMQLFKKYFLIKDNCTDNPKRRDRWYHENIVSSLKESGLLMKGVSETLKHETKEQNGGFSGVLLGALATSVLRNIIGRKSKIPG